MSAKAIFAAAAIAAIACSQNTNAQSTSKTEGWTRLSVSFVKLSSTITEDDDFGNEIEYDADDTPAGIAVGFAKGISLSQSVPLFLEPGAELIWLHNVVEEEESDYASYKWTENMLSLNIPVSVNFKFQLTNAFSIVPYFGPNFKLHFMAKEKEEIEIMGEKDSKSYSVFDDDDYRRFQFGLNVGVGFNINKLHIGYRFAPDLSAFEKSDYGKTKTKQNFVTVGINF